MTIQEAIDYLKSVGLGTFSPRRGGIRVGVIRVLTMQYMRRILSHEDEDLAAVQRLMGHQMGHQNLATMQRYDVRPARPGNTALTDSECIALAIKLKRALLLA